LTERIVPFLEENLLRYFELVSSLPTYFFEDVKKIHKHFFIFELQLWPVKLEIDILPFEVGDCLLAIGDEVINVPFSL